MGAQGTNAADRRHKSAQDLLKVPIAYDAVGDGPAVIELNLVKHGERWEILGFRVNSKALLPQ